MTDLPPNGKLVRDRIPERIAANGGTPRTRIVDGDERKSLLKAKVLEEATEVSETHTTDSLVEELADLYEVLQAIQRAYGIDMSRINDIKQKKWDERGGFERGIVLEGVDD